MLGHCNSSWGAAKGLLIVQVHVSDGFAALSDIIDEDHISIGLSLACHWLVSMRQMVPTIKHNIDTGQLEAKTSCLHWPTQRGRRAGFTGKTTIIPIEQS